MKNRWLRLPRAHTPLERIRIGAMLLAAVLLAAVVGYRTQGHSWIESIYMMVITISTVGYTEDSNVSTETQIFTILVIVFGISTVVYTFGGFMQMLTEGELDKALSTRRRTLGIERMSGHLIICGYGRLGQILAEDMDRRGREFVVIDRDADPLAEAQENEFLFVTGDATEEEVLTIAGVERAEMLVTCLPSDADNVFITLTARNLNPDIHIIARAEQRTTEKKLRQAGANRVVLPALAGARHMGRLVTSPSTADLMDLVVDQKFRDVELDEAKLAPDSPLVGVSVRDTQARSTHRLLVIAVKQACGELLVGPEADYVFQAGDVMIVMGRGEDIEAFRKTLKA